MARPLPSLPNLSWLRSFEAAARHGSFTAAGAEIGLTQAAVSQQIRLLEADLKVDLFRRLRRGVELTPAGAAYLPHIQEAFRSVAQSTAELFGVATGIVVKLKSPISFATLWLAPRLPAFFGAFPNIGLDLDTIHVPADHHDTAGFDIRFGRGDFPGRSSRRLTSERLVPVAAPGLVTRQAAKEGEWPDCPLLSVAGGRELWAHWFALAGLPPGRRPVLRCDSFVVAYEAARAGAGILLGSRPLIDAALQRGELERLSALELAGGTGHFMTHAATANLTPDLEGVLAWWLRQGSLTSS